MGKKRNIQFTIVVVIFIIVAVSWGYIIYKTIVP